ncbi:MAG: diguanylate cyclase [Aquisalimonadaceae bacterium]
MSEVQERRPAVLVADPWRLLGLLLLYYLTARWGGDVAGLRGAVSPIWPASGISLVLALRYGLPIAPLLFGVSIAASWPDLIAAGKGDAISIVSGLLIGFSAALEAMLVAWGIWHLAGNAYLDRPSRFLMAALIAMPLGAVVGTVPQLLGSQLGGLLDVVAADASLQNLIFIWHAMAIADLIGMVSLAPPLLLWLRNPDIRLPGRKALEFVAYAVLAAIVFIVRDQLGMVYLLFVINIVVALRMPTKWAALMVSATSMALLWGLATVGHSPNQEEVYRFFLTDLSLVLILNLMTYAIALFWRDAEIARADLEARVAERTRELEDANARLETLSHTDPLTGASNRRYFLQSGAREIERARKNQTPLALLMIDLDRFKAINDGHGHDVGDVVLQNSVTLLLGELRSTDVLARIGGEEFAVLLPECDEVRVREVAERLRKVIAETPITTPRGAILRVTISIGILVHHPRDDSDLASDEYLERMMREADRNLYLAKDTGRNQVIGPGDVTQSGRD